MNEVHAMEEGFVTYSKIRFNAMDPKLEDIKIEDIAHALSIDTSQYENVGDAVINFFSLSVTIL